MNREKNKKEIKTKQNEMMSAETAITKLATGIVYHESSFTN